MGGHQYTNQPQRQTLHTVCIENWYSKTYHLLLMALMAYSSPILISN
jgi:hypothetical protein